MEVRAEGDNYKGRSMTRSYQARVGGWMLACFGQDIAKNKAERNHRFLEEALELVQSTGCTQADAHLLVDYVFGRDFGVPHQEVGGVMVTLAALCNANGLTIDDAAEDELERVYDKLEHIRKKQASKIQNSALPSSGIKMG